MLQQMLIYTFYSVVFFKDKFLSFMTYVSLVQCSALNLHSFGNSSSVLSNYFTIMSGNRSKKTSKMSCILAIEFYYKKKSMIYILAID